jgi:hypothetical protein
MACDSCGSDELRRDLWHASAAYLRALWIVVLLNVAYGAVDGRRLCRRLASA